MESYSLSGEDLATEVERLRGAGLKFRNDIILGVRLAGDHIGDVTERGEPIVGDTTILLLNAYHEPLDFVLPATIEDSWQVLFDTAIPNTEDASQDAGAAYRLEGRSVALFANHVPQDVELPVNTTQVEYLHRKKRRPLSAIGNRAATS